FEWGRAAAHLGAQAIIPAQVKSQVVTLPESLDNLIKRNVRWLNDYQNAAYADRYQVVLDKIKVREAGLATARGLLLTRAVAHNLAKLMAYKDEYEVARLYTDPAFTEKLRAQF